MKYRVRITSAAWRDLDEICAWISEHDSPGKAEAVLERIYTVAKSVATLPHRGSRLDELPPGAMGDFRQVFFKPYRVIYEIFGKDVVIHVIADGRRNLQSLLLRRLLED